MCVCCWRELYIEYSTSGLFVDGLTQSEFHLRHKSCVALSYNFSSHEPIFFLQTGLDWRFYFYLWTLLKMKKNKQTNIKWQKKSWHGVQKRGKNCRPRIDCRVISSICKKHVHIKINERVCKKCSQKKESQCEESRRQHGKTGALNGFEKNEHFTCRRKKRNKQNADVRKRTPATSTSAFCSDDAVKEKRGKNRKRKRRLLTWSMTRIIKCVDVWKCERKKKRNNRKKKTVRRLSFHGAAKLSPASKAERTASLDNTTRKHCIIRDHK